jgi:hypothetical protein
LGNSINHLTFRRPSGKPVDEENHTAPPGGGGSTSNETTETVKQPEESEEEESRTPVWSYGGLEEENVWGK